jgi:NodT family efflux transporter outer membrane factor (OMF) lipoprotein
MRPLRQITVVICRTTLRNLPRQNNLGVLAPVLLLSRTLLALMPPAVTRLVMFAGLALVALAAGACSVGPNFLRPAAPEHAGYTPKSLPETTVSAAVHGGEAQRLATDRDIPFEWWELFRSPALDALIKRAFAANPTLPAAEAALRQAKEQVYAQQGFFYPTLQGGLNASRNKSSSTLSFVPSQSILYYDLYSAQLNVSYTPDVFGLNRRQVESLEAQAAIQRFQLEAAYITLATNVVSAAIAEASLRGQIAATKEIISEEAKALRILRDQFRLGYAMRIDVAAQEAALAQEQATLPPLEKAFEQNRDLLRVLVGNLPNEDLTETFELDSIELPQALPLSLPSKIVNQRPDVRAAEEALRSANAQVGVAIANRLPQFSITGSYGNSATQFSQLFTPGGVVWSIIGGVTQPLFEGGTLLHRQRAAEEALMQAAYQYRDTVLTAYQNVADTLHAVLSDADALKANLDSERAAKVTLDLTLRQMQVGYVNYLTLIQAELAYQQARLALVQAQAARFSDTAALFQALGGGWWNRKLIALNEK